MPSIRMSRFAGARTTGGAGRCSRSDCPPTSKAVSTGWQSERAHQEFYAREAILERLDDLEDLYLAERRLIDNGAGKSHTCTLEEAGPFGHPVMTAHDWTDKRAMTRSMELMATEVLPALARATA